ncbi:hypothetical protein [Brucella anthropi]|uniref:hypothetical protein n=1 Tax=Brucella anthropi TaxID=529 RepID=UPI00384E32B9
MFGLLDYIKIGAGAAFGIVLMLSFNLLIHDPSIRREARQGYVLEAQKIALEAKLAERDRQIKAGQLVIESYQEQLRNARKAEQERIEQTEQEIADYEKKLAAAGRSCLLNSDDIEWMRK